MIKFLVEKKRTNKNESICLFTKIWILSHDYQVKNQHYKRAALKNSGIIQSNPVIWPCEDLDWTQFKPKSRDFSVTQEHHGIFFPYQRKYLCIANVEISR